MASKKKPKAAAPQEWTVEAILQRANESADLKKKRFLVQ